MPSQIDNNRPPTNAKSKNPPPRRVARDVLREWEQGSAFAADLLEKAAQSGRLSAKNRPLAQNLVYAVIRNQTLLDHIANNLAEGKLDPKTRRVLRLGLAEVLLLDGAPHAAVHETVALASGWAKGVTNAILRRALKEKDAILAGIDALPPPVRWSVPEFLWERWVGQFGAENTAALADWNQQPAPVYLRVNPLKPGLDSSELSPVKGHPDFFQAPGNFPKTWLQTGLAYAQDPSTALATGLLDPQPGESILDACAAPGGKTFAMAVAMKNQGRIVAADRSPARLERMRRNLDRLGVTNAECVVEDGLAANAKTPAGPGFDRILLDVPCSNTGVIRRRIDVRWRLKPGDFEALRETQLGLLRAAVPLLQPGGRLVYSTCSLETDENEAVIEKFLTDTPNFTLVEQRRIVPWRDGFDGAFAAALETKS